MQGLRRVLRPSSRACSHTSKRSIRNRRQHIYGLAGARLFMWTWTLAIAASRPLRQVGCYSGSAANPKGSFIPRGSHRESQELCRPVMCVARLSDHVGQEKKPVGRTCLTTPTCLHIEYDSSGGLADRSPGDSASVFCTR